MTSDDLKVAYVQKYGYNITVPSLSDIFKVKPNALKTPDELKAEKRRNLARVLASPTPDIYKKFSTVMTWIDNIQDTASVLYPAIWLASKSDTKVVSRFIPVLGWVLLGYDLLQIANTVGRAPMAPLRCERMFERVSTDNPLANTLRLSE